MIKNLIYLSLVTLIISCNSAVYKGGDVVHVRNKGADMPAHIFGNFDSKIMMILLHGGPGGNGLEYRSGRYVEMLEEKMMVAYWDQRGQGNSRGNGADEEVDMELLLDDLDKLVIVLKEKYGSDLSFFLYGHSWGGTYGTKFMLSEDRQSQFKGWIESNGAHDIPKLNVEAVKMFISVGNEQIALEKNVEKWREIVDWAMDVDTLNISDEQGGQINSYGHEVEELLDEIESASDNGIKSSFLGSPIDPLVSGVSGSVTSHTLIANGIENVALTDSLFKIQLPSLILWGKYDFVVPPQLGLDAFNLISTPHKELVIYNNSGHSPMNGEGVDYADRIIKFVEKYQ